MTTRRASRTVTTKKSPARPSQTQAAVTRALNRLDSELVSVAVRHAVVVPGLPGLINFLRKEIRRLTGQGAKTPKGAPNVRGKRGQQIA